MINVKNLCKSFGDIAAVRDVSFNVAPGEAFGLLGPNGAGKTTTINMMIGLLKPDAGEVAIDGSYDPADHRVRGRIGVVPQSLSLYDDLTAAENLRFFGRLYSLDEQLLRDRIQWSLDVSGLTDRRNHRVKTFSGGMKRRLNLACGLIHQPQVVFLDEPTVGVDPQSRNHIFETIEALKNEGLTIIYTTHYMEEAQRLCDRVAIIDHGQLLALDTVPRLIVTHGGHSVVTAELRNAPGKDVKVPGRLEGLQLRIETETPIEEVGRLSSGELELQSLHILQPDLESVFLSLTGRSLRD